MTDSRFNPKYANVLCFPRVGLFSNRCVLRALSTQHLPVTSAISCQSSGGGGGVTAAAILVFSAQNTPYFLSVRKLPPDIGPLHLVDPLKRLLPTHPFGFNLNVTSYSEAAPDQPSWSDTTPHNTHILQVSLSRRLSTRGDNTSQETSVVVTTGGAQLSPPVGRAQGSCQISYEAQEGLHNQGLSGPKCHSWEAQVPLYSFSPPY